MNTLGVIGGMGVQATGRFYRMLMDMQAVACEQEYLDVLLYSKPSTPDRTAFITGESTISPLESLQHAAAVLENAGAACIVMPCVTAHYFYDDLSQAVKVPIINMLEETVRHAAGCGYSKVGLLATDGTVEGRFFHKAFAAHGIETIVPEADGQAAVMDLIYAIKRGAYLDIDTGMAPVIHSLQTKGAQAIVLGCTELSLPKEVRGISCIDAMEILAQAALKACGLPVDRASITLV